MKKAGLLLTTLLLMLFSTLSAEARIGSDPSHLEVVATLSFEDRPLSVAVNEALNRIYVGNATGFHVIDGNTNEIIDYVPLSLEVRMLAVNPANNNIFVSGYGGESAVYVLDGTTYSPLGQIHRTLYEPHEIAFNPTTNRVYMADWSVIMGVPDYVRVYDGSTLSEIATIEIPGSREHPYVENVGVAVNPDMNLLYATWTGDNTIHLISGVSHEIVLTVAPNSLGPMVVVNPVTGFVYTGFVGLNGTTLEEVMRMEGEPKAVNPLENIVVWEARYDDDLYLLDGSSNDMLAGVPLGWWIDDVAVNTATGKIYVVHEYYQKLSVIEELPGSYNHIVINEVELNPPGQDTEDNEWIELYNPTSSPVDISGWHFQCDSKGWTRLIPSGAIIDPGEYYTFFATFGGSWLNNTKESIELEDTSSIPWKIADRFPFKADQEDNSLTWQRFPDGTDNWVFEESTPGYPDIPEQADVAPLVAIIVLLTGTTVYLRRLRRN